jgi:serine/threonine protein kinase
MAEVRLEEEACPHCRFPRPEPGWPPDEHLGRLINGEYRVEEKLGVGGFGVVLRARHIKEGHDLGDVVLKFLHTQMADSQSFRQRFLNEARAARRLTSPHIIKVFDFDFDERGHPYIVMEYLEGALLDQLITRGPVEPGRATRIALQIASALQACHDVGVLHRDLTPRNIMLLAGQREDFVKVLDFGIAVLPDTTLSLSTLGTPRYMPPEQIVQKELDRRADIFALGVILFQCFTGQPPILADLPGEYLHRNLSEAPRLLRALDPTLPARLERLLDAMMAKDREARPDSMAAIADELAEIGVEAGWIPEGYSVASDARQTEVWRRPTSMIPPPPVDGQTGPERTETETDTGTDAGGGAGARTVEEEVTSPAVPDRGGARHMLIWGAAAGAVGLMGIVLFVAVSRPPEPQPPSTPSTRDPARDPAPPITSSLPLHGSDQRVEEPGAQPSTDARPPEQVKLRRAPRRPRAPKRRPTKSPRRRPEPPPDTTFKKIPGGL